MEVERLPETKSSKAFGLSALIGGKVLHLEYLEFVQPQTWDRDVWNHLPGVCRWCSRSCFRHLSCDHCSRTVSKL